MVNFIPQYASIGDIIEVLITRKKCLCIIFNLIEKFEINHKYDAKYCNDIGTNIKSSRYSRIKRLQKTLYTYIEVIPLYWNQDKNEYFCREKEMLLYTNLFVYSLLRIDSYKELQDSFNINTIYTTKLSYNNQIYFNNKRVIAQDLNRLEQIYKDYMPYNENLVPINISIYLDALSINNSKQVSKTVCRIKWNDLPDEVRERLTNLPIITIFESQADSRGICKIINEIFGYYLQNSFVWRNVIFICQLISFIEDSQERNKYSHLNCKNNNVNCCTICPIEIYDIMTKYEHKMQPMDADADLSDEDISIVDSNEDYNVINEEKLQHYNLNQTNSHEKYVHFEEKYEEFIIQYFKLDKFYALPISLKGFYCRPNWGWRKIKALNKNNVSPKYYKQFSFKYPHCTLILQDSIKNMCISSYLPSDIPHSFSNMSDQFIQSTLLLCKPQEGEFLKIKLCELAKIKEYNVSILVQHESIMCLEKLSTAILMLQKKFTNCFLNQYIRYFSILSIYVIIYQYHQFPNRKRMFKITLICFNFINHISEMVIEKGKESFITAITLHQFISHTYTTYNMFQFIHRHTTNSLERGMAQIRMGINKSFHKNHNNCIENIALRRDTFRCASGRFQFTIDITGKNVYLWNDNGEFSVSKDFLALKNIELFNDHTSNFFNDTNNQLLFKPKKKICQSNNIIYYNTLIVKDMVHIFLSNNHHYKRSKYHINKYEINNFYSIKDTIGDYFVGKLHSIQSKDDQTFLGEFIVFDWIKVEKNECDVYAETTRIKKIILKDSPQCLELYKVENHNCWIKHHVFSAGKRFCFNLNSVLSNLLFE